MDQIPVVDVSGLDSRETTSQREVAEQLGQACRSIGFLYVANHGISEGDAQRCFCRRQCVAHHRYSPVLTDAVAFAIPGMKGDRST